MSRPAKDRPANARRAWSPLNAPAAAGTLIGLEIHVRADQWRFLERYKELLPIKVRGAKYGSDGWVSLIVREAMDLLIEYANHQAFLEVRNSAAKRGARLSPGNPANVDRTIVQWSADQRAKRKGRAEAMRRAKCAMAVWQPGAYRSLLDQWTGEDEELEDEEIVDEDEDDDED